MGFATWPWAFGVHGVRGDSAREWCRRSVAAHRVVACVAASAALYARALMVVSTRQPDAVSPAGVTIATLVYVSFAVIAIVRWPAGGLGRLDELILSFTATGLRVTCDVTGQARQLPEAVDLTAYRLIQESLTNTAKHAAGTSASIRLAFRPKTLALAVEDHGPPAGGSGASLATGSGAGLVSGLEAGSGVGEEGHGIIGMRERAAALGGWLTAGPRAEGGFRVLAELPAPTPPAPVGAAP